MATRIPTSEEILQLQFEELRSNYPVRILMGNEDSVFLREESRESHMHIIGTTGEGKSKFLEWLMRGDIDRLKEDEHLPNKERTSIGFCFLDPTELGDTMYKVLRYCLKVGYKKVLVIDPHQSRKFNKVVPINPLGKYDPIQEDACISNVLDTFRVLYQQKDWSQTPIIRRYLKSIITLLWNAKLTISDSIWFTEPMYKAQRERILSHTPVDNRHRAMVEYAFKHQRLFIEYQSTVRRLEEVFQPSLRQMFGEKEGINFTSLIGNGWVVLVNLYAGMGFEKIHTRLLGTMIINEIIYALDRIKLSGWTKKYYLYIDEAGRYANENLADLLAYKRKSGLRVIVSHQYDEQFYDEYILQAIRQLCKIKIAFHQPDPQARMQTVKQMFGGELKDRDVSYALEKLNMQHCVIKKPKKKPMTVRVPDTPDIDLDLAPHLKEIYAGKNYVDIKLEKPKPDEIHYETRRATKPPEETSEAAHRPDSKTTAPPRPDSEDPFRRLRKDEITHPKDDSK